MNSATNTTFCCIVCGVVTNRCIICNVLATEDERSQYILRGAKFQHCFCGMMGVIGDVTHFETIID